MIETGGISWIDLFLYFQCSRWLFTAESKWTSSKGGKLLYDNGFTVLQF